MNLDELVFIKGFEGLYSVNRRGQIYSHIHNIFMKPGLCTNGYCHIVLHKNKKKKDCRVHRLIAETFIPRIPEKKEVNHKDGNKTNNYADNLEWSSRLENNLHGMYVLHTIRPPPASKGEDCHLSKLTEKQVLEIREKYKNGMSVMKIAKQYNVYNTNIYHIVNRRTWRHI